MTAYRVRILGAPRTKKTHNQIVVAGGKHRVMPSKAWRQWCVTAQILYGEKHGFTFAQPPTLPEVAYNCEALIYRDADRGDAVGYYQGLADLLEKRGVIANDSCIVQWDGSRLLIDREQPRIELTLTEVWVA